LGYSKNEIDCLIKASLSDNFLNNNDFRSSIIEAYNALQDEESKYLFACLYLLHYIKQSGNDAVFIQQRMIEETLKKRLIEKGNDLSEYSEYDRDFFFGEQYFSLKSDGWKAVENDEIFIDCGAYDGRTIIAFIDYSNGSYKKIYSFEPIPELYDRMVKRVNEAAVEKIELLQKGVWSSETSLTFAENTSSSSVDENGAIHVDVVSIDNIIPEDEMVTFIKMDVEGAELEALKGAEKTIRRCNPRLAVCIYHKPQDIIEIPGFIMSLDSNYRLYIRHHSPTRQETVLYALPQKENKL
jgi:FkbM family methyltransferase